MMDAIRSLVKGYQEWLQDQIELREINGWVEITTPFIDRHNDYLQIYARQEGETILLTDGGYVINDLLDSGLEFNTPRRSEILNASIRAYNVSLTGKELQTYANSEDFCSRKHSLLQAMLTINDLYYLATPNVARLFYEDVQSWLIHSEIRYVPNYKITGLNKFEHNFDFSIPATPRTNQPLRLIQSVNRLNRDRAESLSFAWLNTRQSRSFDSKFYAFINDTDSSPNQPLIEALLAYEIKPVPWSERQEVQAELAA